MFQDARAFVRALAGGGEPAAADAPAHAVPVLEGGFDHIVMNLPASAVLFLGERARTLRLLRLLCAQLGPDVFLLSQTHSRARSPVPTGVAAACQWCTATRS